MSKSFGIARQIRALKVGGYVFVYTEKNRAKARNIARTLRDAGVIEFEVDTRPAVDGNGKSGFKISAL